MVEEKEKKKRTLLGLNNMKLRGDKAVAITAYDFNTARLVEAAGVDWILVGDSVGNIVLGYADTRPVTMEEMLVFSKAVRRGAPRTFVVGDMPLGSYQQSDAHAIDNALRFIKEAEMDAIKCEGGLRMAPRVEAMANAGIAVMGHIGYTPQSTDLVGTVQGNTADRFRVLREDALALQEAGAFAILLEAIPNFPAGLIARELKIPIYGIGAGREVDGVLSIVNDVLGLGTFRARFAKPYCDLNATIGSALGSYTAEVRTGNFPADEHLYQIKDEGKRAIERYALSNGIIKGVLPATDANGGNSE